MARQSTDGSWRRLMSLRGRLHAASEFDQTPRNRGQINLTIKINADLRGPLPTSSLDL